MKKLVIASNNLGKIKEIKRILSDIEIDVLSLKDMSLDIDVEEDGLTFEENAKKKSIEIYKELIKKGESNFIIMSDDSGLEVDYLKGEPGVFSARYAGEHGNDKKNNEKLLLNLKGVDYQNRKARFVCQLAIINDKNEYKSIRGTVEGYILENEKGEGGFGYDPLFFYEPLNKSFAELTMEEKNKISHRGIALQKAKKIIEELL
ncbi:MULTISPECIES: XTP/dITP diphosphatase [unclassified Clostridium]|jgi:non-canonical purine NTP pyrophosphatase, rdgB/HAM1 family|uniref:XTP/dITP diphosphatase n=1 Tax=unclassified Clostridium TaxID=2614128 RepID=UPI0025C49244|nr:XTP/dITP diphosphatase [Clostridium sp.]MDY2630512.1 XTP/dITP diphosphatase [Clostridium sp.]MDY6227952.1 XTP/dITP diphosphatase [Clostridium sp.]